MIVAWTMLNYLALFLIVAAAAQLGTSHAFAWYTLCLALALVSSPIAIAYVFGLVFLDTWENRDAWRVVGCLAFLQPALATWTVLRQKQRWMVESTHLTVVPPVVSLVTRKTFFPSRWPSRCIGQAARGRGCLQCRLAVIVTCACYICKCACYPCLTDGRSFISRGYF